MEKDISHFDKMCEENHFDREYLAYLHPADLEIVFMVCMSKLSRKKMIEKLNAERKPFRSFTTHKLARKIGEVRSELHRLRWFALKFDITDNLKKISFDEIQEKVREFKELLAKEDNE